MCQAVATAGRAPGPGLPLAAQADCFFFFSNPAPVGPTPLRRSPPSPSPDPPTAHQVLLHTTHGTLDIELWPKEAPLACRNFVQLAAEGAYDGTPFHRILPGATIQAGDTGGGSVYGAPFKDEFHSRLRFNHRGLVAAAGGGGGAAATNGPQFFVTLAPAPHLDRKHTIFGRLAGDSVYAAAAIGEVEVGPDDAPVPPGPVVKSAEVVWNPFDDLAPRTTPAAAAAARVAAAGSSAGAGFGGPKACCDAVHRAGKGWAGPGRLMAFAVAAALSSWKWTQAITTVSSRRLQRHGR